MRVELTNVGFADPYPADECWNLYNVDLEVIETSSPGCKPSILAVKLQAHINMCLGWESNPQNHGSEPRTYTNSVTQAYRTGWCWPPYGWALRPNYKNPTLQTCILYLSEVFLVLPSLTLPFNNCANNCSIIKLNK